MWCRVWCMAEEGRGDPRFLPPPFTRCLFSSYGDGRGREEDRDEKGWGKGVEITQRKTKVAQNTQVLVLAQIKNLFKKLYSLFGESPIGLHARPLPSVSQRPQKPLKVENTLVVRPPSFPPPPILAGGEEFRKALLFLHHTPFQWRKAARRRRRRRRPRRIFSSTA